MRSCFQTSIRSIRAHAGGGAGGSGTGASSSGLGGGGCRGGAGGAQANATAARTRALRRTSRARGLPLAAALLALVAAGAARSDGSTLEPEDRTAPLRPVVGEERADLVAPDDTLLDVAFRNGLGFEAIKRLNPEIDTWIPEPGSVVRLPSRVILPDVEEKGLVINIPEMRLFDFTREGGPEILAAAIGDAEDPTPIGEFRIGEKRFDPEWVVPKSIRAKRPNLPERVPAGPDNPLGSRWLRIGQTSYGIHGTNIRWSIGREATHGCVRLYESDIHALFERTALGTPLRIVYQPVKWGREGRDILVEAHPDLYARVPDPLASALAPLRSHGLLEHVDVARVWRALDEARGVPIVVGRLPKPPTPPQEAPD